MTKVGLYTPSPDGLPNFNNFATNQSKKKEKTCETNSSGNHLKNRVDDSRPLRCDRSRVEKQSPPPQKKRLKKITNQEVLVNWKLLAVALKSRCHLNNGWAQLGIKWQHSTNEVLDLCCDSHRLLSSWGKSWERNVWQVRGHVSLLIKICIWDQNWNEVINFIAIDKLCKLLRATLLRQAVHLIMQYSHS